MHEFSVVCHAAISLYFSIGTLRYWHKILDNKFGNGTWKQPQMTLWHFPDNAIWLPWTDQRAGKRWLCYIVWHKESCSLLGVWAPYSWLSRQESRGGPSKMWLPWGCFPTWVFQVLHLWSWVRVIFVFEWFVVLPAKYSHIYHAGSADVCIVIVISCLCFELVILFYLESFWDVYSMGL